MRPRTWRATWIPLLAGVVVLFAVALVVGRYPLKLGEALRLLLGSGDRSSLEAAILLRVRLPRALAAVMIGANLAGAGVVFQSSFQNPLVDSRILGIGSAAAFGAALGMLFTASTATVHLLAFAFGVIAVVLVAAIGWRLGASRLVLVIVGVLVSALFTSLLGLVKYVADPLSTLPAITYWQLGSLSRVDWSEIPALAGVSVVGLGTLLSLRWRLNLLALSDIEGESLGIHVRVERIALLLVGTALVAASVATAGMIGWVGLIVPHIARLLVGSDHRRTLPASLLLGAGLMLALDAVARTATVAEVPLGVLTGVLGVPAFLVLFGTMIRRRGTV